MFVQGAVRSYILLLLRKFPKIKRLSSLEFENLSQSQTVKAFKISVLTFTILDFK